MGFASLYPSYEPSCFLLPVGQITLVDFGQRIARQRRERTGNRSRQNAIFTNRLNMIAPFKSSRENKSIPFFRNKWFLSRHPASQEGRYGQSSRNVERGMRWTGLAADEQRGHGR